MNEPLLIEGKQMRSVDMKRLLPNGRGDQMVGWESGGGGGVGGVGGDM